MHNQLVPTGSGAHAQICPFASTLLYQSDVRAYVPYNYAVKGIVTGQHVGAPAKDQKIPALLVGSTHGLDEVVLGACLDKTLDRPAHTNGGQVRQGSGTRHRTPGRKRRHGLDGLI